jgi:Fe2+ transport system protein FeoA
MTLAEALDGQKLIVVGIKSEDVLVQAVRFGIDEGANITVAKNIAGGPVVICKNQLEIAVGRDVARAIEVDLEPGNG